MDFTIALLLDGLLCVFACVSQSSLAKTDDASMDGFSLDNSRHDSIEA